MRKILYLECLSGISGDMTVGALLDLGADKDVLLKALDSLGVGGYHLHFGRAMKCGIDAYDFDVHLEAKEGGHDHGGGVHAHHTGHRNLYEIYEIIDRLDSAERVKNLAKTMFRIVAEAESKAHGLPVDRVHFHEVGAIDSIVDIISVAVCVDNLRVDDVVVSALTEGRGHVRCQHGVIPVPVPAVVNIASAHGLTLHLTPQEGEMVTPTGAAIAAALRTREDLPESCQIVRTGVGAGKKEFSQANVVRAMLLLSKDEEEHKAESKDAMWVLETNIDDCGGETLAFSMELLLEAGAADVWSTPICMKKSRPAYMVSVLCKKEEVEKMEAIILSQTTTIGIRRHPVERTVLPRATRTVKTPYGEADVKICTLGSQTFCYPEYESVRRVCRESRLDFQSVYREIQEAGLSAVQAVKRGGKSDE